VIISKEIKLKYKSFKLWLLRLIKTLISSNNFLSEQYLMERDLEDIVKECREFIELKKKEKSYRHNE
jgi:hypothetical protein